MNSNKNLILGTIKGYEFNQIKPFLISLKNSGYSGDICLLASEISPKTIEALHQYGVNLYFFNEFSFSLPLLCKKGHWQFNKKIPIHRLFDLDIYRKFARFAFNIPTLFGDNKNKYLIQSRIAHRFLFVMSSRYLLYYLYLSEYGKNYSKIMLTDVRDVLFQRNPFDFDFDDCLCCFLEDKGKTISECWVHTEWIGQGFGDSALREIGDRMISCAGTTIGTRDYIMLYLEAMIAYLLKLQYHPSSGVDQGVHNYIIHKGLIKNVRFFENHYGPILTMMSVKENQLCFNNSGFLINEDGSVINVLHQYDRHSPEVKNQMVVYRESESPF